MKFMLMCVLFLLPINLIASDYKPDVHIFPVELDRVLDADTMDVYVDLGLWLSHHVRMCSQFALSQTKTIENLHVWHPTVFIFN